MASTPPPGFHTVTPRMVVDDQPAAVAFLRTVFGAAGAVEPGRPTEARIGDSLVMVSESGEREVFPVFLYIYVDEVEATYRRALDAGAVSVEAPVDTPYGDRRAMVRDPFGNVYQIAARVS
jgi:PhnB protein